MVSNRYAVFDDLQNEFYGNTLPDFRAGRISQPHFLDEMESVELYSASVCDFLTWDFEILQEKMHRILGQQYNPNAVSRLERMIEITNSNGLSTTYGLMLIPMGNEIPRPVISEEGLKIIMGKSYAINAILFDDLSEQGGDWDKERILQFMDELQSI